MKTFAIAVVVFAFAAGATVAAQDMVEYSHASSTAAASLQGLANKLNASLPKSATQGGPGPRVQTVGPSTSGSAPEPAAKPAPPAVFILTDGKQLESNHYVLTAQDLMIQDGPKPQTIPLSAVNREATVAANQKRGLSLKFPNSTSQMMISF